MTSANDVAISIVNATLGRDLVVRRRISEKWANEVLDGFDKYLSQGYNIVPQIFTWNTSCQWYIKKLVEKGIPYRVIQRGAGVKEVVVETERCEHCKGKGYVASK
jgi:hypothetical protein